LVTVAGANFGTAQGTVNFNGTAAPVAIWSPNKIMVTVPSATISWTVVVTAGVVASNGVSFMNWVLENGTMLFGKMLKPDHAAFCAVSSNHSS